MKHMYIDLCWRELYRAASLAFLQKERETGWWRDIASITLVIFLILPKVVVLVDSSRTSMQNKRVGDSRHVGAASVCPLLLLFFLFLFYLFTSVGKEQKLIC